jgi:hypothetical protein
LTSAVKHRDWKVATALVQPVRSSQVGISLKRLLAATMNRLLQIGLPSCEVLLENTVNEKVGTAGTLKER